MGLNEKIIFLTILGLGAIVGVITYNVFLGLEPTPGDTRSIYRQDLPSDTAEASAGKKSSVDLTSVEPDYTLTILEGAATQGNPDYDPKELSVKNGEIIKVDNVDNVPHTVTNGEGPNDPNAGKLFDTGIINGGENSVLEIKDISSGDYVYYCTVHPYMTGNLKIE